MTTPINPTRVAAVERLIKVFRWERAVHLVTTTLALLMLFTVAGLLIAKGQADATELTLLFGSTGLITVTGSRLLTMWSQALSVMVGQDLEKSK